MIIIKKSNIPPPWYYLLDTMWKTLISAISSLVNLCKNVGGGVLDQSKYQVRGGRGWGGGWWWLRVGLRRGVKRKYVNELIEFLGKFMHQPGLLPDQTLAQLRLNNKELDCSPKVTKTPSLPLYYRLHPAPSTFNKAEHISGELSASCLLAGC